MGHPQRPGMAIRSSSVGQSTLRVGEQDTNMSSTFSEAGRGARFDSARGVLEVAGYELALDRTASPGELLNWLIHVGRLCEPERLPEVVDALDDVCQIVFGKGLQYVFLPRGESVACLASRRNRASAA